MKFKHAIEKLKEGKYVRRPMWEEGSYWKLGENQTIVWKDNTIAHVHLNQIEANDWESFSPIKREYVLKFVEPQVTIQEDSKEDFKKLMKWTEEKFMSMVFVRSSFKVFLKLEKEKLE